MRNLLVLPSTLIAALAAAPLAADETSATMTVTARVLARAVVTIEQQPAEVIVTSADISRGWVAVEQSLDVRVRTNSRQGYLLQAAKTSDAFAAVELAFGDTIMNVSEESWVARPAVDGGDVLRMQVKMRLAPGATPGRHPMPVSVSATAL